jgi:hypothetical protein
MTSIWPLVWMAPCLKNKMLLYSTLVLIYKHSNNKNHQPCVPSSITGEAMYLLNHWGSPVPPQSLGKPCTSSITGETLYLLNHWGSPVPPQSLGKPCLSSITGESLYLLNHWGNIAPSSVTGEAMYLLNHCGFIFQWQFQNNSK